MTCAHCGQATPGLVPICTNCAQPYVTSLAQAQLVNREPRQQPQPTLSHQQPNTHPAGGLIR